MVKTEIPAKALESNSRFTRHWNDPTARPIDISRRMYDISTRWQKKRDVCGRQKKYWSWQGFVQLINQRKGLVDPTAKAANSQDCKWGDGLESKRSSRFIQEKTHIGLLLRSICRSLLSSDLRPEQIWPPMSSIIPATGKLVSQTVRAQIMKASRNHLRRRLEAKMKIRNRATKYK